MNLKSKALGLVAALGLSFSIVAPAFAGATGDTATATVAILDGGVFAVDISDATLNVPVGTTTSAAATTGFTATGSLNIVFTDTKSYRSGSWLDLQAANFQSVNLRTPRPYQTLPANVPYQIAASNLKVLKNYNAVQGRYSFGAWTTTGYAIGDIGSVPDGSFTQFGGTTGNFDFGTGGPTAYHDWTESPTTNSLDVSRHISRVLPGPGTAGSADTNGSTQVLDVALTVPPAQPADTYTSTLTITVVPASL